MALGADMMLNALMRPIMKVPHIRALPCGILWAIPVSGQCRAVAWAGRTFLPHPGHTGPTTLAPLAPGCTECVATAVAFVDRSPLRP